MNNWDYDSDYTDPILPVYNYSNAGAILTIRLMEVPDFRALFTSYIELFYAKIWPSDVLTSRIQSLQTFLLPEVKVRDLIDSIEPFCLSRFYWRFNRSQRAKGYLWLFVIY
jgi:hypothetical protein